VDYLLFEFLSMHFSSLPCGFLLYEMSPHVEML